MEISSSWVWMVRFWLNEKLATKIEAVELVRFHSRGIRVLYIFLRAGTILKRICSLHVHSRIGNMII